MTLDEKLRVAKQREEAAASKRRKIAAMISDRNDKAYSRAKILLGEAAITSGFVAEVLGLLPASEREFVVSTLQLPFSSRLETETSRG